MAVDYYAEATEIAEALAAEGREPEASELREAIAAGSTATEILMGIRWHLEKIGRNPMRDLEARRKMQGLVKQLKSALR